MSTTHGLFCEEALARTSEIFAVLEQESDAREAAAMNIADYALLHGRWMWPYRTKIVSLIRESINARSGTERIALLTEAKDLYGALPGKLSFINMCSNFDSQFFDTTLAFEEAIEACISEKDDLFRLRACKLASVASKPMRFRYTAPGGDRHYCVEYDSL